MAMIDKNPKLTN